MNELRYTGLSIESRVVIYFEMARDSTLVRTYAEMLTAALALIYLLQDADIDKVATAGRLISHASRCGIMDTSIISALGNLAEGGEKNDAGRKNDPIQSEK